MILEVKQEKLLQTLNNFFHDLLEKKIVDALLIPQEVPSGKVTLQTLVKDPSKLGKINPLAPVIVVNSAKIISTLAFKDIGQKIGVVLRPCEIRALVELAKLEQVDMKNLIVIGVDCLGTYKVRDYARLVSKKGDGYSLALESLRGLKEEGLRAACKICRYFVPENTDIKICLIGVDAGGGVAVEVSSQDIANGLGLREDGGMDGRKEAIFHLIQEKERLRESIFSEIQDRFSSIEGLLDEFATCTRCFNCRNACPICYCKECIFETQTFTYEPERYIEWAKRRGIIKIPMDTLLYHLVRMNHMVTSCVGCGLCEEACPNALPISILFSSIAQNVQGLFEYVPGRDVKEGLPTTTFKEEELQPR